MSAGGSGPEPPPEAEWGSGMDAVSDECYRAENLGEVIAAIRQGKHPAHLDACARCRALVASYQAFLDPPDLPTSAELEDVARRVRIPVAAGAVPESQETPLGFLRRLMRVFEIPWLRPAVAAGLVGLAVIVYLGVRPEGIFEPRSGVLRGDVPATSATVRLLPMQAAADGGLILTWQAVPEADAYAVIFYRVDLSEIARREIAAGTTLTLRPEELAPLRAGEPRYWQVVAQRSGAELMRSGPHDFVVPAEAGR